MKVFLACFKCEHIIYVPTPKPNLCQNALSFNHDGPKGRWRALRPLTLSVTAPMKHHCMDGKARSGLVYGQVSPQHWSGMQALPLLRSSEAFLGLLF